MVKIGRSSNLNFGEFFFEESIVKHFPPSHITSNFFHDHCVPILGNFVFDGLLIQRGLSTHIGVSDYPLPMCWWYSLTVPPTLIYNLFISQFPQLVCDALECGDLVNFFTFLPSALNTLPGRKWTFIKYKHTLETSEVRCQTTAIKQVWQ